MKINYEKPCSEVVQMTTESIIATSVVNVQALMTGDLDMEVQDASVWGAWE